MRFGIYATTSLLAGAGLVGYTYYTRQQFYPTVIYLVTSKVSVMVLCNVAFVMTVLFGQVFKRIFLGTLRDAELEMLYDHARFAIAETCFTLSVFREEMSLRVLGLFTILLFLKTFHWLCQWRGEHIEQSEVVSRITHVRLVLLMALLAAVDMVFVVVSGLQVAERGPSFLILFVTLVAVFLRYILHLIDARVEGTWTNKFTYVFYLELVTEIVKLIVYLNLQRRIVTYFRYRRITANMNERFPSPTEDEMNETDRICIICREEMTLDSSKKLPCSHIFHLNCLRMWLQRQQVRLISSLLASISYNSLVDVDQNNPPHPPVQPPAAVPEAPRRDAVPPPRNLPGFGQPLQPAAAPVMQPIPPPPQQQHQQPAPPQQPGATPAPGAEVHQGAPQFPPPSHHPGVPPPPSFPSTNVPAEFTGLDPSSAHYMQSIHYGLQLDPRFLQYQLDMLQAQLHVLRATSLALQSQPGLNHIPAPVTRESSTTPLPQVSTPAVADDPPASPQQEPVNVPSEETPLTPEEIERDRRRDALRRIYAKRYGGASEAAVDEEYTN
ncbi:hypothetical protein B5M09_004382 [Aphanomyces astaci]|uniref:RING-type E3 ubiquitin transferase n=1 Tax=Aphanomyces astaci TaxID=112090 RepID=A0A425D9J3_APHAT|nr:hypothetical protein B5M09_004382 [Aphanomyces astaci]